VITALRLVSIILVVATVVPSVAHALELPGKLRLTPEHYFAVQRIYYPGFTAIGAAEPLSILVLAALLVPPVETTTFWLVAASLLAVMITHALQEFSGQNRADSALPVPRPIIDFGSAPTVAFWELLALLEAAGAKTIRVTSSRA